MKDLFVFVADADALAVMRTVLERPKAMGIRTIEFDVDRHVGRDSGIVSTGPELARSKKGKFQKLLMLWDHHGSGWENRYTPNDAAAMLQQRLNRVTWEGNSCAVVVVPELEEWLWHNMASMTKHLKISLPTLTAWLNEYARNHGITPEEAKRQTPKELFEFVLHKKFQRRKALPRDFEQIASVASMKGWLNSESFATVVKTLREWFPG